MSSDSENTTYDDVLATVKTFEVSDLFKLLKAIASEAEKKSKVAAKATTTRAPAKKAGSMPKGAIPQQLKKPRAWVEFTLKDALENGWEAFTVIQKKKDKETNTVTEEQIEMPASILHNGAHIYKDSVTEKAPEGKQLIHKEAMSLSKQRKESNHASYAVFESTYVEEPSDDDKSVSSSTSSKKIVVKKTAAEKEAEATAKKEAKEAEKAAKKAEKEAEKEAKKAEKEAEKVAKKAEKEATKKPAVKVPAAATPIKKKAATETAPPAPIKKKPAPKVEKTEEVPSDGMVHPCTIKGKKYLRNAEGETWLMGTDGGVGEWAGLYDSKSDKLDTSAPEPVYEDEE